MFDLIKRRSESTGSSALLAFATRYTHTPFEMGHLGDIEAMVDILLKFVPA